MKNHDNWWLPHHFSQKKQNLETRQTVIKAVRRFFDDQDFWEVETPALQIQPGAEVHVHAFQTELLSPDLNNQSTRYLHTSPEFSMKKLLVAGCEKIYQICPVYRNAEGSSQHVCEFKMLEWYRTGVTYEQIMDDTIGLLRAVATAAKIKSFQKGNYESNPFEDWEKISVFEAFQKYAGIDIAKDWLPELNTQNTEEWDARFFKVFMEQIEPYLGQGSPTILYDYPAHMAALSKVKKNDPRVAERFEVYVCGLELANAFTELTDAKTQLKRFEDDMAEKKRIYGETWPIDHNFIAALEQGMPDAGGIALGIDRLVMLACGADDIKDVLFCE